jgi:acyl-coenzyme A synthetase/AMP-(fatty) acid ligase
LVLAEGTPDWPDAIRMWRLAQKHRVTIVGVVPKMVRQMMRSGAEQALESIDLSGLRATISVGEPWTREAWEWFFRHVCAERIPILNYAGGTECGGAILIGSFIRSISPCAFSYPVPGCGADVVDPSSRSVGANEVGELVVRRPSIGMTRGLWRSPEHDLESYWRVIPDLGVQGDLGDVGDCASSERELAEAVAQRLGASYRPKRIMFVADLPRTRNLKIMRRVVRSILTGSPPGDLSSLMNPRAPDIIARAARDALAAAEFKTSLSDLPG